MKTLLVILISLFFSSEGNNCADFYEKTLPVEVEALVNKKEENNQYYVLELKSKADGKILKLLLLKNTTGKEIYDFVKPGSHIKKRKDELKISALTPTADGGFQGQLFPDLCK